MSSVDLTLAFCALFRNHKTIYCLAFLCFVPEGEVADEHPTLYGRDCDRTFDLLGCSTRGEN
jgi:hypothetical protein